MRRVVITGLGAITPCGNNVPDTWSAMLERRSGVGPVQRFDASAYPVRIAAEIKGFDAEALLGRKQARRMDPFTQYALVAAMESEGGDDAAVAVAIRPRRSDISMRSLLLEIDPSTSILLSPPRVGRQESSSRYPSYSSSFAGGGGARARITYRASSSQFAAL